MMSCSMVWAAPLSQEPTMKTAMPRMKNRLRPYMSDSLPNTGTMLVEESMYVVKTQLYRVIPPRLAMTFGMAVPTTVWSRAATSMPRSSPASAISCARRESVSSMAGPLGLCPRTTMKRLLKYVHGCRYFFLFARRQVSHYILDTAQGSPVQLLEEVLAF